MAEEDKFLLLFAIQPHCGLPNILLLPTQTDGLVGSRLPEARGETGTRQPTKTASVAQNNFFMKKMQEKAKQNLLIGPRTMMTVSYLEIVGLDCLCNSL